MGGKSQHSLFGPNPRIGTEVQDDSLIPKSGLFYRCGVKSTSGKGLGLFSEEDISAGETIIIERPSLILGPITEEQDARFWCDPQNVSRKFANTDLISNYMKLSPEDQSDIMSLYNGHEKRFPSRDWYPRACPDGTTLAGKFLTNRFKISSKLTGIFFRCAIINHSCDPNCNFRILGEKDTIGTKNQWLEITANKEIKAGDELLIYYFPYDKSFDERQAFLHFRYGFKCVCSRCAEEKARLYPDGFYNDIFSCSKIEFQQRKLSSESGRVQGRNMLTVVKTISNGISIFQKNGIVLEESPLMLITKEELMIISMDSGQPRQNYHPMVTRFLQLDIASRMEFLKLSSWRNCSYLADTPRTNDQMPSPERLLGIWKTNRFSLDDGVEGVFQTISNLNHSCAPNCRVLWNPEQKILNLVAAQPLKVGDQITICYDHDQICDLPTEKRQQYLRQNYGFTCRCPLCLQWIIKQDPPLQEIQTRPVIPCSYKLSESGSSSSALLRQEHTENRRRLG